MHDAMPLMKLAALVSLMALVGVGPTIAILGGARGLARTGDPVPWLPAALASAASLAIMAVLAAVTLSEPEATSPGTASLANPLRHLGPGVALGLVGSGLSLTVGAASVTLATVGRPGRGARRTTRHRWALAAASGVGLMFASFTVLWQPRWIGLPLAVVVAVAVALTVQIGLWDGSDRVRMGRDRAAVLLSVGLIHGCVGTWIGAELWFFDAVLTEPNIDRVHLAFIDRTAVLPIAVLGVAVALFIGGGLAVSRGRWLGLVVLGSVPALVAVTPGRAMPAWASAQQALAGGVGLPVARTLEGARPASGLGRSSLDDCRLWRFNGRWQAFERDDQVRAVPSCAEPTAPRVVPSDLAVTTLVDGSAPGDHLWLQVRVPGLPDGLDHRVLATRVVGADDDAVVLAVPGVTVQQLVSTCLSAGTPCTVGLPPIP